MFDREQREREKQTSQGSLWPSALSKPKFWVAGVEHIAAQTLAVYRELAPTSVPKAIVGEVAA